MGLEKITSRIGAVRLLQSHPQVKLCILCSHCTHLPGHLLSTSPTYMALMKSFLGNFPLLVDTSPIGHTVTFSKLVFAGLYNVFELLNGVIGVLCTCLIILMMRCD
jgi:hypothetical protein